MDRKQRFALQVCKFYDKYAPEKAHSIGEIVDYWFENQQEFNRSLMEAYEHNLSEFPDPGAKSAASKSKFMKQVRAFYTQYDPDQLPTVPDVVKFYFKRQELLNRSLKAQYGHDLTENEDPLKMAKVSDMMKGLAAYGQTAIVANATAVVMEVGRKAKQKAEQTALGAKHAAATEHVAKDPDPEDAEASPPPEPGDTEAPPPSEPRPPPPSTVHDCKNGRLLH